MARTYIHAQLPETYIHTYVLRRLRLKHTYIHVCILTRLLEVISLTCMHAWELKHTYTLEGFKHACMHAWGLKHTYMHTLLLAKFSKNQGGDFVKAERLIFKGKLTFFVQISIGRFSVDPEGQNILIGVSQLY